MKTIRTTLSVLLLFITMSVAHAVQFLPIGSKAELRAYCIDNAHSVSAGMGSYLPLGNMANGYVELSQRTPEGISNTIRNLKLRIEVPNPQDWIYENGNVFDKDGYQLFWATKQFKLEAAKGSWKLPSDYGDLLLDLVDEVPISMPGVTYAFITIQNDYGETIDSQRIRAENGKIFFPWRLAHARAILATYVEDGKGVTGGETEVGQPGWSYWNVESGAPITPEKFDVTIKAGMNGSLSFTDVSHVHIPVQTKGTYGINPTATYTSSGKQWITVSGKTSEARWFIGLKVRQAGTLEWATSYDVKVNPQNGSRYIEVPIYASGVWHFVPIWNEGDFNEIGASIEPTEPPKGVVGGIVEQ
jgi:hypothetical protein